jgi:hypothetical protein
LDRQRLASREAQRKQNMISRVDGSLRLHEHNVQALRSEAYLRVGLDLDAIDRYHLFHTV